MSLTTAPPEHAPPTPSRRTAAGWFRAFWRWHFYASLVVVPVLAVLAVTGLVYLLRFEIEPRLHADLMRVEQPAGADFAQPYAAQLIAVDAPTRTRRSPRSPSPPAPTRAPASP